MKNRFGITQYNTVPSNPNTMLNNEILMLLLTTRDTYTLYGSLHRTHTVPFTSWWDMTSGHGMSSYISSI